MIIYLLQMPYRDFYLRGAMRRFYQKPGEGIGSVVWDCGYVMCKYFEECFSEYHFKNKKILEVLSLNFDDVENKFSKKALFFQKDGMIQQNFQHIKEFHKIVLYIHSYFILVGILIPNPSGGEWYRPCWYYAGFIWCQHHHDGSPRGPPTLQDQCS